MNMNVPVVLTLEVVVAVVVVEFPWLVSPSAVQHLLRYIFVLRSSNLAPPSNRNGLLLLSFLLFFFWVRHWMRRMEDADSEKPFATDSHRYNVTLMMWKTHRPTDRPNVGLPILVSAWRSSFLNFTFYFSHLQVQGVRNRNLAVVVVAKWSKQTLPPLLMIGNNSDEKQNKKMAGVAACLQIGEDY
jgi:hypothetical protein